MLLFAAVIFSDPTVTVSFTSLPLPVALKRLSEATGKVLEPSMALQHEVLMMRVKDVPRDEVLRRVANLYAAEWSPQADGKLILRPEAAKIRAREATTMAKARETLRGSLAYVAKRLKEQPERFGPKEADALTKRQGAEEAARKQAEETGNYERAVTSGSAHEETPGWRALGRLLPTFDQNQLLAMPSSTRAVWAEQPTRLQNPFPAASRAILQRYRDELAAMKPDADLVRVKVVFKRWEHGEAHTAEIFAYGPHGRLVDSASIRMANDNTELKVPYSQRFPVPARGDETPMKLPAEAIEHGRVLNRRKQPAVERAALVAKWRPILSDPEHFEPTGWLPSVGYVAAAEALNMNLIGAPSELTGLVYEALPPNETPSQFLARRRFGLTIEKNGWITVENIEKLTRTPRSRGGNLLREALRRGGVSVDSAAAFAAASPDIWPFTTWVGEALGVFFPAGGPRSVLATTGDDTLLRFWFELGDENRRNLREGRTVDLRRLPLRAQPYLDFMIFHEERIQGVEPTEVFANGVTGTLRLEVVENPIFTSWRASEGEPSDVVPQDAGEFGVALAKGNSWRQIPADAYRQRDRFRLGVQRTYRLSFTFNGATTLDDSLTEVFFDPTTPAVNQLPENLLGLVEAARQKALAEPAKPTTTGGAPPP